MRKIVVILIALVALVACESKKQAAPAPVPAWPGKITVATTPAPPTINGDTLFRVHVEDAAGKPVTGAAVKASLVMVTMDMGKNDVNLTDKGNGDYEGTGKFTMGGTWNIVVTVSANAVKGEQSLPVVVHADGVGITVRDYPRQS